METRNYGITVKVLKEKKKAKTNCQPRILYLARIWFNKEGEIRIFSAERKQGDLITNTLVLYKCRGKTSSQKKMKNGWSGRYLDWWKDYDNFYVKLPVAVV